MKSTLKPSMAIQNVGLSTTDTRACWKRKVFRWRIKRL